MKKAIFFILILASFLRLYLITDVPPSASLDEASIGWNAYSILQTGKDEYGTSFPLLLRAYDDYRPALYVYLVAPFVKVFGLNILSVKLPSVILSVLAVYATYFFAKELFRKQKILNPEHLAILSSFLLAISPWHIYISRLGHEVNIAFSFFLFAVLFFLKRKIYLSASFFLLSFISYQSEKIFIPVMLLGIFIVFKDEILALKKKIVIASVVSFIVLAPFLKATFSEDALLRFKATNIFDANKSRFIDQSLLLHKANKEGDIVGKILYNRRFLSFQIVSEAYLSHFNPVWLFTNASGDRHKIPSIGLLHIWTLPFILIGIYLLVSRNFDSKNRKLLFIWVLAAPLSASITTESPHALRSLTFLPIWEIFAALGLIFAFAFLKKKNLEKPAFFLSSLVIILTIGFLYKQYFKVFPKSQSASFQYALSKTIPYVIENEKYYKKIVFGNNDNLYQSYMFFLFYTKYDPSTYQKEGGTASGGYSATHKFAKYEFRPINIGNEKKGNMYVANHNELNLKGVLAKQIKTLKIISNFDESPAIKIVTK